MRFMIIVKATKDSEDRGSEGRRPVPIFVSPRDD
jgi:hypothetical protein